MAELGSSYVKTNGRIELKGASTSGRLRVSEHNADLLTELVDKDHDTVCFADDGGQFS